MANNLKIKKYWLTTLCMVFCSLASFAQDLSDAEIGFDVNRTTTYLKGLGLSTENISREILMMREKSQNEFIERNKEHQAFFQNIASKQTASGRSAKISAVPQSEKDALQTLYNATNGANWTTKTGWDFSTEVTSWNITTRTGWFGIIVTDGHITSIILENNNLNNSNVTFPVLSNLPYLETLSLYNNPLLTGPLTNFQYLTSLKYIDLSSCKFTDTLLPITPLTKLEKLALSGNITGTIPDEIYNFKNLKNISLGNSNLTGGFSSRLSELVNLEEINLHANPNFGGIIPAQIGNLLLLKHLDLSGSGITGGIPSSFVNLVNLEIVDISRNRIEGEIPTEIGNLKKLTLLWLQINSLTGNIPSSMGNMPKLGQLVLSYNQLEGTVPTSFQSLSDLNFLSLDSNQLSNTFPDLSGLTKLSGLRLQTNKFTFADFAAQYSAYKSRISLFEYAPQANTDVASTVTGSPTGSVTLKMHEDGRSTPNQLYQWYKGFAPAGVAISGAIAREYTISNLKASDAGNYYCISTNPQITNPGLTTQNLVLTRNQVTVTLRNCPAIAGDLKSTAEKFYTNAQSKFSFETTATGLTYEWSAATVAGTPVNTLPSNTTGLYSYTFTEAGDYVVTLIVKDDNQCPTTFTKTIKVVDRYCAKEPVDFAFETTSTNLNYTWTSTDSSGTIVNTVTNRTGLYTFTPQLPGDYVIELVANGASQCVSLFTKNITIDECVPFISCTKDNPLSPEMHRLFIAMISKLATAPNGSDVNVYAHKEIAAMAPYTTEKTAMIYNFINTSSAISFSFTKTAAESDVYLPKSATGSITAIDLSKYEDALTATTVATTYNNGIPNTKDGHVKNIDFCPKELSCVSHVALVIDESGSIDATEFNKIKKQLKSFVLQQAKTNDDIGSNIHVSITGMSDSDLNTRTDYIEPLKMTMSNVGQFNDWIDQLGKRYGRTGISQASDYWKSGLDGALAYQMKPTFVIMVTDGAQTDDVPGLRATFKKFNNNNKAETEPKLPHLYVVGIENGFYIDRDSYTSKGLPRDQDPNYNPSLAPKDNLAARTTPFLTKSLQYLLDLTPTEWPLSDINQFTVGTYYGHDNFELLASDETYFSDKLADGEVVCGKAAIKDFCDDCFSFKPEPGKEYILSAWVKEESFTQVKTYENPIIKIVFYNNKEALDIPAQRIESLDIKANGDIIDGWQRVVKKFKIPAATITMAIELENMSPSIPVYFDDIRIHPLQGSVKSFVYDPVTFKLMSELDENNYSTFYEYDNEGGLVRVKKETAKGIKTIQETRSGSVINITQ